MESYATAWIDRHDYFEDTSTARDRANFKGYSASIWYKRADGSMVKADIYGVYLSAHGRNQGLLWTTSHVVHLALHPTTLY